MKHRKGARLLFKAVLAKALRPKEREIIGSFHRQASVRPLTTDQARLLAEMAARYHTTVPDVVAPLPTWNFGPLPLKPPGRAA